MIILFMLAIILAGVFVYWKFVLSPATAPERRGAWVENEVIWVRLRPDNREVFTPVPLSGQTVYLVSVIGVFPCDPYKADGVYRTDGHGNFTVRHQALRIGGYAVSVTKPEGWREDRSEHVYSFYIDGGDERVSLCLCDLRGRHHLMVALTPMPADTIPVAKRRKLRGAALTIPACSVDLQSEVLLRGTVYRFTFSGVYHYSYRVADAAYRADGDPPEFRHGYDGLTVDGVAARRQDSWDEEDRQAHIFRCLFEGRGKPVRFHLSPPGGQESAEGISVNIEIMPPETKTARMLEAEQSEQSLDAASQARQKRVDALRRYVHCRANLLDPQYREEFGRRNRQSILGSWKEQWIKEYEDLHQDTELAAALRQQAPEVLKWHELRIGMIMAAERAVILPNKPGQQQALPAREITATTARYVSHCLTELFQFTEACDRERQALAQDEEDELHTPVIERYERLMAFLYSNLARFGIHAQTPEEAERQYLAACPPPKPGLYEDIQRRISAGEDVSADPIRARVEDLFREELKLGYQRKRAVERKNGRERDAIDARLSAIRREKAAAVDFLKSIGYPVEFKDYREQDTSIVQEFIRLHNEKKQILQMLQGEDDAQAAEQVEALYAQERFKLFDADSGSYT